MARMVFAETFLDDAEAIYSPRVLRYLRSILSMLESFPQSGSLDVPLSIRCRFGGEIRKCSMEPFDLIYSYDAETDTVTVRGLVSQKSAR